MKREQAGFLLIVLSVIALLCGCVESYPESTQTLDFGQSFNNNTRLVLFTSSQYYFEDKQNEIVPKLDLAINGGQYNIVSVKTEYSSGYLTSAEIAYDISGRGDGNKVRVKLIQSDKYYYEDKTKEVKPKLDNLVNSGEYVITKINTVYAQGYLLAAEVYYIEN